MIKRILNNDFSNVITREDNGKQTECNSTDNKKCQRIDKEEKVLVISFPNTIVHPRAVMIKILKGNKANSLPMHE